MNQVDERTIELIDLEAVLPCNHDDCDDAASHLIICPLCGAHEGLCTPHAEQVLNAPEGSWGTFTKSCGHTVEQSLIRVVPI